MEPLSPIHPISHMITSSNEQKAINRETSIVELPPKNLQPKQQPPSANDDLCGASTSISPGSASVAPPAILTTSPPAWSFFPVQQYSPTETEIGNHPIRQRLSIHGDHVAASGWGTRQEESTLPDIGLSERQEELDTKQESEKEESAKMTEVKEGDKVAWNWGSGAPGGTASEVVTDGDAKMVSHRGNEVKKKGSPENPAVHIERPGNDVVKKASELEVEEKGPNHGKGGDHKKDEGEKEETNGDAKTGEKRSASEANKGDEKKDAAPKANGDAKEPPKKKGRPAKSGGAAGGAAKKETKKKEPKAAATADGKPRRSGRNKA